MKPSSLKATGPTSQAAWTVSGGCTSTWIAWLFCSSISFAFRGRAGPGDSVFFRGCSEQDLHVALGLREPGGIRVHRDRFDTLDVAVVERAYHLPARAPDSDDGDFRVHGVLKQAADDFFDVIPRYHSSASTHPATDRARPEGGSLR